MPILKKPMPVLKSRCWFSGSVEIGSRRTKVGFRRVEVDSLRANQGSGIRKASVGRKSEAQAAVCKRLFPRDPNRCHPAEGASLFRPGVCNNDKSVWNKIRSTYINPQLDTCSSHF
jgi:hypothetical protein